MMSGQEGNQEEDRTRGEDRTQEKEEESRDLKMDENVTLMSRKSLQSMRKSAKEQTTILGTSGGGPGSATTPSTASASVPVIDDRKFLSTPV